MLQTLPTKCEALGSTPNSAKKKKKVNKWMDELMINRVASGMDGTGP